MYSENFIANDWFNVEVFNKNKYTLTNQENKDVTELWLQILKGLKFPNELKETVSYSKNLKELSLKTHAEVSVCIIAKNEQDSIRKCINSIYEFSDEIIFIDTGSIDLTKKIVKEIASEKVKIFDYTWQDDFSDARNYSIQKASKEWILIIDADEYVSSDELTKLRLLIDMLDR
ncbi:glycosyltransferase, partial [Enterococcus faecalis]